MICYLKYLPDLIIVDYCDSIMMHAPIFTMYVGPMKVKEIKLKNFESSDIMFSIHSTKQHAGMLV